MQKLGDVLQFSNQIVHPKNSPTGISTFVGLEHIERDTGIRTGSEKIDLGLMTGRRARFQAGDIVYGYLRPYLNKVWIAEFDGICSVDQYVFKVRPIADRNYVYHFLRSAKFLKAAPIATTPGQLPRIRSGEISATPIPLPPLDEQKRIATILDKADQLRQKRRQAIALLDILTQSIFREMFGSRLLTAGLGIALAEVAEIQIGPFGSLLHKEDYRDGGVPLINPMHIIDGSIIPTNEMTVNLKKYAELGRYHLDVGDVVLGRRGEMGRCAVVDEAAKGYLCGTGSMFLRPNKGALNPVFLTTLLRSRPVVRHLENASAGVTMQNLNKIVVSAMKFNLPPIDQQVEFAESIDGVRKSVRHLACSHGDLMSLFSSLQHRAFSGQL